MNSLLRRVRNLATINKCFAHDIAQAFDKLKNQTLLDCWAIKHDLRKALGQLPAALRKSIGGKISNTESVSALPCASHPCKFISALRTTLRSLVPRS